MPLALAVLMVVFPLFGDKLATLGLSGGGPVLGTVQRTDQFAVKEAPLMRPPPSPFHPGFSL